MRPDVPLLFALAVAGCSAPVTVEFDAEMATISDTPFDLDSSALGTTATGHFTYDTITPDSTRDDATRGTYQHDAGGAFVLSFGDVTVTGSAKPYVEVEDLGSDTFRFLDGVQTLTNPTSIMKVSGSEREDVNLFIAISDDTGASFGDDTLPDPFPMLDPDIPHTFSLQDEGGVILFQFTDLRQIQSEG